MSKSMRIAWAGAEPVAIAGTGAGAEAGAGASKGEW